MISYFDRTQKLPFRFHFVWAALALFAWGGRQVWQWKQNGFFSFAIFLKGFLLLLLVSMIYGAACRRRPSFFLLGFFPLLWLATSRIQWDICAQLDSHYWVWLAGFLLSELFLFFLTDGRKLLFVLSFLWIGLSTIFYFSFFNFLLFGWVRSGFFLKRAEWVRFGFPIVGLIVLFWLKIWSFFQFFWYGLYMVFFNDLFISFFFLGWLGAMSFLTRKNSWLPAFGPLFLLPLGFLFLSKPDLYSPLIEDLLKWVLIFFAGFGWESFRRDVMDRSWHGRLLWFVLGLAFFGGVL